MYKLAAEQRVIVEAMTKIAGAYGYQLTAPIAQEIMARCYQSPVLIMKVAGEMMTPEEALQWQTYRANMAPNMVGGMIPGIGPLMASGMTPGWSGTLGHIMLPNLVGAGLGGLAGGALGSLGGPAGGILGAGAGMIGGGMLGSYLGGRHYAPQNGPATPDLWNNPAMLGMGLGAIPGIPLGLMAHGRLPEEARYH